MLPDGNQLLKEVRVFSIAAIENLDCRNFAGKIELSSMKRTSQGMRVDMSHTVIMGKRITSPLAEGHD
jgi:hypothetical protein